MQNDQQPIVRCSVNIKSYPGLTVIILGTVEIDGGGSIPVVSLCVSSGEFPL